MDTEKRFAEVKQALEAWRDEEIARIHAENNAHAARTREWVRDQLSKSIARSLAAYHESLARIKALREANAKNDSPEAKALMEQLYARMEESAELDYERTVTSIKKTYRTFLDSK